MDALETEDGSVWTMSVPCNVLSIEPHAVSEMTRTVAVPGWRRSEAKDRVKNALPRANGFVDE